VVFVLVLVAVGLAAWNISLWLRLQDQGGQLAEQRQLLSAVAAGASVSSLAGTEAAPGARGTLVKDPAGGRAFLLVSRLPDLPADQEYQIWRIKGNVPMGVGTFSPTDPGEQLLIVGTDFTGADAIGISIEPRGGSLAPTGPIVLLGAF
jgi:anti-sigma-K factor RskA